MEKKPIRRQRTTDEGEGRLWKIISKVGLGMLVVVLALTMMQCTVKSPKAPEWDTTLAVPIINRTYTMRELIEKADQDGLVMDSADNIVYTMDYDVDTISLDGSNLSVPDVSYSVSEVMGPIDLDPPVMAPVSTALSDIGPLSAAIPGTVPAVSFSVQNNLPAITSFTSATISSGTMRVIVSNQLGIDLDTVNILIYDVTNADTVDSYSFLSGIASGSVDTALFVLDGKTLSNSLRFQADCHNVATLILSASNLELSCTTEFAAGMTVSSATAQIPALSPITFSQQAALGNPGDLDVIQSADLTSGSLSLTVTNNTALDATLLVSLPDLDSSGTSFSVSQLVSAGANAVINRDVSNYTLIPTDQTLPQVIDIDVTASVAGSGVSFVTVNETDDFSVTASLTGLQFGSVTGVFASTEATFDPVVEALEVPEGFDGFGLVSTIIELEIENAVGLAGYIDLTLSDGSGKTLLISDSIAAAIGSSPTTTTITVIDSTFLSPLPDSIIFSGSATFGDGVNPGTISANDYIVARIRITAPIEAIITETTLDTDIATESINQSDIEMITDHVREVRFIYTITNHLPLGASVQILMGGDTTRLAGQDNQVIPDYTLGANGELTITAAPTIDGIVPPDSVSTAGEQTIIISNAQLDFLQNDPLFIGTQITLAGSNGQPVKLTSNDYITITGYLEVDYHVDGNF